MIARVLHGLRELFADDDPAEPLYDPVHVGVVLIVAMTVIGVLYWLLWTLLVYEGGLFVKIKAVLGILLTARTLKDYGYERAPYDMGVFQGWLGNVIALALCMTVIAGLFHLYRITAARHASRQ